LLLRRYYKASPKLIHWLEKAALQYRAEYKMKWKWYFHVKAHYIQVDPFKSYSMRAYYKYIL